MAFLTYWWIVHCSASYQVSVWNVSICISNINLLPFRPANRMPWLSDRQKGRFLLQKRPYERYFYGKAAMRKNSIIYFQYFMDINIMDRIKYDNDIANRLNISISIYSVMPSTNWIALATKIFLFNIIEKSSAWIGLQRP